MHRSPSSARLERALFLSIAISYLSVKTGPQVDDPGVDFIAPALRAVKERITSDSHESYFSLDST